MFIEPNHRITSECHTFMQFFWFPLVNLLYLGSCAHGDNTSWDDHMICRWHHTIWDRVHTSHPSTTLRWRHNERNGVSNHQPHDCFLNSRRRSKKTSKLRVAGLGAGNSPVTGLFPTQRASNAENVSIWWRHHEPLHTFFYTFHRTNIKIIWDDILGELSLNFKSFYCSPGYFVPIWICPIDSTILLRDPFPKRNCSILVIYNFCLVCFNVVIILSAGAWFY